MKKNILIIEIVIIVFCLFMAGFMYFTQNNQKTNKQTEEKNNSHLSPATFTVVTSGEGLYDDTYENDRYIYKGKNPNNYIKFNDELWRIISFESDGTIKIIATTPVKNKMFNDSRGSDYYKEGDYCYGAFFGECNAYGQTTYKNIDDNHEYSTGMLNYSYPNLTVHEGITENSDINKYLNGSYYKSLSAEAKKLISNHKFYIGGHYDPNQTYINGGAYDKTYATYMEYYESQRRAEEAITWTGKIGLPSKIDIIDSVAGDENKECADWFNDECAQASYLDKDDVYWLITPNTNQEDVLIYEDESIEETSSDYELDAYPVVYLKNNLVLLGKGTKNEPFEIK